MSQAGERVAIVGGGLAGCEAAWRLAHAGIAVDLYEMRPRRGTAAHTTDRLGELVCSNSFRNSTLETAVGLLKEEMRQLGSLVMQVADRHQVPAGSCLAVDRVGFAAEVTRLIEAEPRIRLVREEVTTISDSLTIMASGPLTSPALSAALSEALGTRHLYFYDAIAPTVTAESIDMSIAWKASRYDKGGDDYINCPFGRDEYYAFVTAVASAEKVPTRDFERCSISKLHAHREMVRRGPDTLAFGPMRPVELIDPRTGRAPSPASSCVRTMPGRLFSMVGFQTKMTYRAAARLSHDSGAGPGGLRPARGCTATPTSTRRRCCSVPAGGAPQASAADRADRRCRGYVSRRRQTARQAQRGPHDPRVAGRAAARHRWARCLRTSPSAAARLSAHERELWPLSPLARPLRRPGRKRRRSPSARSPPSRAGGRAGAGAAPVGSASVA
jgi:hypothetical protein